MGTILKTPAAPEARKSLTVKLPAKLIAELGEVEKTAKGKALDFPTEEIVEKALTRAIKKAQGELATKQAQWIAKAGTEPEKQAAGASA